MKMFCSALLSSAIATQLVLAPVASAQTSDAAFNERPQVSLTDLSNHLSGNSVTYSNETLKETSFAGNLTQVTKGLTFKMKESIQGKRYAIRYEAPAKSMMVNKKLTPTVQQINFTLFDATERLTPDSKFAANSNFIAKRSIWFQAGESAQTFFERVDGVRQSFEKTLVSRVAQNQATSVKGTIAKKIASALIQNAMADWKYGLGLFIRDIISGVLFYLGWVVGGLGLGIAFLCAISGTMNNGKIDKKTQIVMYSSFFGGLTLAGLLMWSSSKMDDWWPKPKPKPMAN